MHIHYYTDKATGIVKQFKIKMNLTYSISFVRLENVKKGFVFLKAKVCKFQSLCNTFVPKQPSYNYKNRIKLKS